MPCDIVLVGIQLVSTVFMKQSWSAGLSTDCKGSLNAQIHLKTDPEKQGYEIVLFDSVIKK